MQQKSQGVFSLSGAELIPSNRWRLLVLLPDTIWIVIWLIFLYILSYFPESALAVMSTILRLCHMVLLRVFLGISSKSFCMFSKKTFFFKFPSHSDAKCAAQILCSHHSTKANSLLYTRGAHAVHFLTDWIIPTAQQKNLIHQGIS